MSTVLDVVDNALLVLVLVIAAGSFILVVALGLARLLARRPPREPGPGE